MDADEQAEDQSSADRRRSAKALSNKRKWIEIKSEEKRITDGVATRDEISRKIKRQEARKVRNKIYYDKKKKAMKLAATTTTTSNNQQGSEQRQAKVQPQYRITYNEVRREQRKINSLLPETAMQKALRLARNLKERQRYTLLSIEQRSVYRRMFSEAALGKAIVARINANRRARRAKRRLELMMKMLGHMQSDENKAYVNIQNVKLLLCKPVHSIIDYLTGPLCNMDKEIVEGMDHILRLAQYLQLRRINDLYNAEQFAAKKRDNKDDRSAHIIQHFHGITQSFNEGAIDRTLKDFFVKLMREESGGYNTVALTCAINQQSYRSCNHTGFQVVSDTVNRNCESGKGMLPSRNAIQQCGEEIAAGTETKVPAIFDENRRIYHVNLVDELMNITGMKFIQKNQSLTADLVMNNLDPEYQCDADWKGCVVKVNMKNDPILVAEILAKAIDMNYSCDGFELASASNGAVGLIATFKGKEVLQHLNKNYKEESKNPEYGDRAGCHSINSVLFQGLAIGKDDYETSKRLTEATFKLVQELHRPGRLFYNSTNKQYFKFKNSITVDKKEGNIITVTGGGSYMTKFFDIYTEDNQETKGLMSWRQCDHCFEKGK